MDLCHIVDGIPVRPERHNRETLPSSPRAGTNSAEHMGAEKAKRSVSPSTLVNCTKNGASNVKPPSPVVAPEPSAKHREVPQQGSSTSDTTPDPSIAQYPKGGAQQSTPVISATKKRRLAATEQQQLPYRGSEHVGDANMPARAPPEHSSSRSPQRPAQPQLTQLSDPYQHCHYHQLQHIVCAPDSQPVAIPLEAEVSHLTAQPLAITTVPHAGMLENVASPAYPGGLQQYATLSSSGPVIAQSGYMIGNALAGQLAGQRVLLPAERGVVMIVPLQLPQVPVTLIQSQPTMHQSVAEQPKPGPAQRCARTAMTTPGPEKPATQASNERILVLEKKLSSTGVATKTRQYSCSQCGRSFYRRSDLVRHIQIHLGIKPNLCQFCGKAFIQRSALTVHVRVHTGEKPYSCKVCGRQFSDSSSLARHRRIHQRQRYQNAGSESTSGSTSPSIQDPPVTTN